MPAWPGPNTLLEHRIVHYLLVNLDKKEFIRPVALGAPPGREYADVGADYGPCDWHWLILLAHLIERRTGPNPVTGQPRQSGPWAGDRIEILRGDQACDLVPED